MYSKIIGQFVLIILLVVNPNLSFNQKSFSEYMESWDTKIELASKYLTEAESEFKAGDELTGCVTQRRAADYGIEATESLLMAFKISKTTTDLSDIESGLNKWKEIRDFC